MEGGREERAGGKRSKSVPDARKGFDAPVNLTSLASPESVTSLANLVFATVHNTQPNRFFLIVLQRHTKTCCAGTMHRSNPKYQLQRETHRDGKEDFITRKCAWQ